MMSSSHLEMLETMLDCSTVRSCLSELQKKQNSRYPTQNWLERISSNAFHPLIQKHHCLTLTWKFRNAYAKSAEKNPLNRIVPTVTYLFINSQWKCGSQFSMHNECTSDKICGTQLGLLYSSFSCLISFWMHTSFHILIDQLITKNILVLHLVMFHMQSTYLIKLTVFFCSPLSIRLGQFYCTSSPLFTLLAFSLERILLFIFSILIIQIPC